MDRVRQRSPSFWLPAGAGVVLSAITVVVYIHLASFEHGPKITRQIGTLAWVVVGSLALGSVPTYARVRYRVVSPLLFAVGGYLVALVTSWSSMVSSAQSAGAGITPTDFEMWIWLWVLPLGVALVLGALEYYARPYVGSLLAGSRISR